jgi:hypothetical protein
MWAYALFATADEKLSAVCVLVVCGIMVVRELVSEREAPQ